MSICQITGRDCDCTAEGACPHEHKDDVLDTDDFDFEDERDYDFEMRAAQATYQLDGEH